MLQVQKLARLDQPVPLLAAFPFQFTRPDSVATAIAPAVARTYNGKRDYSTCVEEESIDPPFFGKSRNDVKKDD